MIEARYGKPGIAGFFDAETFTVHIDKTLDRKRQWAALRHELIHAIIDVDKDVEGI